MSGLKPFERIPFEELAEMPARAHPYARIASRQVTVQSRAFGSLNVHVREHGEGPPLLLIHGLMTASYSWRYVYEELGRHYRVIAPDLPGAGRSDNPVARYGADELQAFIGELQDTLGIVGCNAIGNSLGGYLCMKRALAEPRAFRRLVNIHSPAMPAAKYYALHALMTLPGMGEVLDLLIRRDPARWVWKNVHYYDETLKTREELREYGDPLATRAGRRAFGSYLRYAMAPAGFRALARQLATQTFPVPLLLLYSRQDPLVPPENGPYLARLIPSAGLSWIDATSHFAHVDTPEPVVREALAFFRER